MRATFTLFIIFYMIYPSSAQDILIKKNGEEVKAKVITITPQEIAYKLFTVPGDSLTTAEELRVAKSEVFMIKYENGTKEVFGENNSSQPNDSEDVKLVATAPVEPPLIKKDKAGQFQKGQADALTYYDGYRGAATGTLIVSLLSPLVGLIPAVACSSTMPQAHNLTYPNHKEFMDIDYQSGYRQRARKTKSSKVWKNWGIGLGVNLALVLLLSQ